MYTILNNIMTKSLQPKLYFVGLLLLFFMFMPFNCTFVIFRVFYGGNGRKSRVGILLLCVNILV